MKKYKTGLLGVPEEDAARSVGEAFGFGAMMRAFEAVWSDEDDRGAFVVGPCLSAVVPCECDKPHKCDWCAGCGWLTKHVKDLKNASKNATVSIETSVGMVLKAEGVITYNPSQPIRWTRVTAPTVGRAWKAPVYIGSDGNEIVDFNAQIEIGWDEEV